MAVVAGKQMLQQFVDFPVFVASELHILLKGEIAGAARITSRMKSGIASSFLRLSSSQACFVGMGGEIIRQRRDGATVRWY
jgi:hypothetical protein